MKHAVAHAPVWNTATFGLGMRTTTAELTNLQHHFLMCQGSRGPLFFLHCAADAMTGFLAARLVTSVIAFALVIRLTSLAW